MLVAGGVLVCAAVVVIILAPMKREAERQIIKAPGLVIVPTMLDTLSSDTAWCGTFQLVWNDMKNEVVGGDVTYTPQIAMAENLNKETFTADMLSDEYYYKNWGKKTLELKAEIERGIKEKFGETSDILDDFDWSEEALDDSGPDRYFFYVMLKRKFEYPKVFTRLEEGDFNGKGGVRYFGVDVTTKSDVKKQVKVLYYNSDEDFAIMVKTKGDDELVFVKNPEGNTFSAIYDEVERRADKFAGVKSLEEMDELKIPDLDFDEKRVFEEFEGLKFPIRDGGVGEIIKAIQTIKFSLDEKGGEVKSEAGMDFVATSAPSDPPTPRYFYLNNTFAMFIREKGQPQPYFAARVDDIEKFQSK